jgi:hypothetical protein
MVLILALEAYRNRLPSVFATDKIFAKKTLGNCIQSCNKLQRLPEHLGASEEHAILLDFLIALSNHLL